MLALLLGLSLAQAADTPVYGRIFSHFENLTDLEAGARDILELTSFLESEEMVAEHDLHRAEHQAAWFAEHQPAVIRALQQPTIELGYHPHPTTPFTRVIEGMADLPWDQAVAAFAEFESCAVDFRTSEVDCSRPGGASLLQEIVGKPLTSVNNGGPHAVSTYVYREIYDIPTQLDTGSPSWDDVFGADTYLYWYMGQLVMKHPRAAQLTTWTDSPPAAVARSLPGEGPHVISLLGSDKMAAPSANEYLNENWVPGRSTPESLRVPASQRNPAGKRQQWIERYRRHARDLARLAQRSGGEILGPTRLLELVHPPIEPLSRADLLDLARQLNAHSGRQLPLGLPVGERVISLADAWEGLARALVSYRDGGALPESVIAQGIDGPIGDLVGPRQMMRGHREPLEGETLLAAIPRIEERVAFELVVPEGAAPLYASEALILMARLLLRVESDDELGPIPRTELPLRLDPEGARLSSTSRGPQSAAGARGARGRGRGGPAATSRWDGYTLLQWWTAKPARWREEG